MQDEKVKKYKLTVTTLAFYGMSESHKNILQEHFQKLHLPLPKYATTGEPGSWTSTVFFLLEGREYSVKGKECNSKKLAEQTAAMEAYNSIKKDNPVKASKWRKSYYETAIIVDVENKPIVNKLAEIYPSVDIYAFVGKYHPLASTTYPKNVSVILSNSTRPDGTDSCIQIHLGMFMYTRLYSYYIIVSQDKFAFSAADTMIQLNKPTYVAVSTEQVEEIFEKL